MARSFVLQANFRRVDNCVGLPNTFTTECTAHSLRSGCFAKNTEKTF